MKDVATGDIELASTSATGVPANRESDRPAVSADGTTVAFSSIATNLDPADPDGIRDVYVKILDTGTIEVASTSDTGVPSNGRSETTDLSGDGRTVAFSSVATNLDPADDSGFTYVLYAKDLNTGDLVLASSSDEGANANANSRGGSLSGDGRLLAFQSFATNLDPADTTTDEDVFVKDLTTGDIRLVSTPDDVRSSGGVLSADGSAVAYSIEVDGVLQAYVMDLASGFLVLASITVAGVSGNSDSFAASLSADGEIVGLATTATNFDPRDKGSAFDVYVKDLTTGALELASTSDAGVKADQPCYGGLLSADGTAVMLRSRSTTLDPADPDVVGDVYLKSLGGLAPRDPRVAEGNSGTKLMPFVITLARPSLPQ